MDIIIFIVLVLGMYMLHEENVVLAEGVDAILKHLGVEEDKDD